MYNSYLPAYHSSGISPNSPGFEFVAGVDICLGFLTSLAYVVLYQIYNEGFLKFAFKKGRRKSFFVSPFSQIV